MLYSERQLCPYFKMPAIFVMRDDRAAKLRY